MTFRLHVWGSGALFQRRELKDRVSYDVIPPFAAARIFESIYWNPGMRWRIRRIHVLHPIVVEHRSSQQEGGRSLHFLVEPSYLIEADFDMRPGSEGEAAMHLAGFLGRAENGESFRQPILGAPDFPASWRLLEVDEDNPRRVWNPGVSVDLGWLPYGFDDLDNGSFLYFRAGLEQGIVNVPDPTTGCFVRGRNGQIDVRPLNVTASR